MKKNIRDLIIVFSLTSLSLTGQAHQRHHPHGNALFNTLFGMSFTSGGLTTSTEATVVHNHFDSHHHGHWKKQAHAVLNEIKLYETTNTLSPSLQHLIDKQENQLQENIQEKKEENKNIVESQQKLAEINFIGKTEDKILSLLGQPQLSRVDGSVYTLRYDSDNCRLFLFFNNSLTKKRVEYFELRGENTDLLNSKQALEQCYREFKLIN